MSIHEGHRQRLKNRFLNEGLDNFEEIHVLELLLFYCIPQKDTNPIAHNLLEKFSTISGVFGASIEELCTVKGIKEHSAVFLKTIPAFSQFYSSLAVREKKTIATSFDAGQYVCGMIGGLTKEVFAILCLDAQRKVIAFEILEEGTVSRSDVSPRKVVECAIRHNASQVIHAHKHPSGTLCASENDRILTGRLCDLLEGMDIMVVDHIIATHGDKYLSMADSSLMPN